MDASEWRPSAAASEWVLTQVNSALLGTKDVEYAENELTRASLPLHPDPPKRWDTFLALVQALRTTPRTAAILDAGGEFYSSFLPSLRHLGFTDLTAINTVFPASKAVEGIHYRYGDVTGSDLPDGHFAFVACLSVIEHGVELGAFMQEQARILAPGGHLFVSTDFWEAPIDTRGQAAYGVPIRIFDPTGIHDLVRCAAICGFQLVKELELRCSDRVVHWQPFDLAYTFVNLMWRKEGALR